MTSLTTFLFQLTFLLVLIQVQGRCIVQTQLFTIGVRSYVTSCFCPKRPIATVSTQIQGIYPSRIPAVVSCFRRRNYQLMKECRKGRVQFLTVAEKISRQCVSVRVRNYSAKRSAGFSFHRKSCYIKLRDYKPNFNTLEWSCICPYDVTKKVQVITGSAVFNTKWRKGLERIRYCTRQDSKILTGLCVTGSQDFSRGARQSLKRCVAKFKFGIVG